MATEAPAAIALARSPEYLMPPSAIAGTSAAAHASTHSMIAVSCGTPTPATIRVVQIEPGPNSDLHGVGAGIDQRLCAICRRDIAGHHLGDVAQPAHLFDCRQDAFGMAVRGIDDQHVHAGVEQGFGPFQPGVADPGRRCNPQPALFVLAGVGMALGLVHILDRDQAGADAVLVHHQQLLDPVLVQQALGFGPVDRFGHGDQIFRWSSARAPGCCGMSAKRTSRWVIIPASRPLPRSTTGTPDIR